MPYVAGKRLKIGPGYVQIGEPVKDAEKMVRFRALLAQGYLRFVEKTQDETQRGSLVETPESFRLEKPAHTGTVKSSNQESVQVTPKGEPVRVDGTYEPDRAADDGYQYTPPSTESAAAASTSTSTLSPTRPPKPRKNVPIELG